LTVISGLCSRAGVKRFSSNLKRPESKARRHFDSLDVSDLQKNHEKGRQASRAVFMGVTRRTGSQGKIKWSGMTGTCQGVSKS